MFRIVSALAGKTVTVFLVEKLRFEHSGQRHVITGPKDSVLVTLTWRIAQTRPVFPHMSLLQHMAIIFHLPTTN
jgi:hypothetical protein